MTTTQQHDERARVTIGGAQIRPGPGYFTVTAHGPRPRCRLRLFGELDQATAPTLQTVLDQVRATGRRYVTLDLSEMTFLAAAGLAVFTQADRQFRDAAGSMVLAYPTDHARQLLRVSGLDTTLTLHPRAAGPASRALARPRLAAMHPIGEPRPVSTASAPRRSTGASR